MVLLSSASFFMQIRANTIPAMVNLKESIYIGGTTSRESFTTTKAKPQIAAVRSIPKDAMNVMACDLFVVFVFMFL